MARYATRNYAWLTKAAFLIGLGMFVIGVLGEWTIHSQLAGIPPWEDTFFFDVEVLGIIVALLSPFVFGIFLPLTES